MAKGYELTSKLTQEKRAAFIMALANTGRVDIAAETIGASRLGVYKLRKRDEHFAAAWDEAKRVSALKLEDEATRRAVDGVDEPVFFQGAEISTIKKYSDTLLIFLMKGAMPDKYADHSKHQHDVAGGLTLNVITGVPRKQIPSDIKDASYEEIETDVSDLC